MRAGPESSVRLWAAGPRYTKALASRLSGENLEWCYFGTDMAPRSKVAGILGSANAVSISEELNRVAHEIKQPFLDWIAEIGSRQKDKLNWWASRIASKSPLQTDLFLLVCYHKLFRSWVVGGTQSRTRIVVVEDPWLRSLLRRDFAAAPGVAVLDSKSAVGADTAYWLARVPLSMIYVVLRYSWMRFIAGTVLSGSWPIREQANPQEPAVLLYTWIEKSCFITRDKLYDSYTGRLEEILTHNGERVKRLTPLSIQTQFLGSLKPFARNLLITPRYTTIWDIFRSATSFFRITGFRTLSMLEGGDYAPLFYRELLREWGAPGFATYRLSYLAFRRGARHCRGRVKALIYPFENQPWEKMLCLAFRDEAPGVRLIGYQHTSVPSLFLCYFLGKQESRYVPLPDVIAANGRATLDRLRHGGFPEEKLVDGGALRFEHLFDGKESRRLRGRTSKEDYRILVAFPTSRLSSACLLQDLLELFPTPFLDSDRERPLTFILKCHPDLPWGMFGNGEHKLPEWFTVSARPLSELMETVDMFLYVPPTGTWREAYGAGLPVLKYRGEFLDIDSDIDSTGVRGVSELPVSSRDTLRRTMHGLLTQASDSAPQKRKGFLDQVFSPVNEKVWLQLVKT